MSIEHAILGLLSRQALTGYDLKKLFEGSQALYWSGNNNQIYRTLVAMHEEGLVRMAVEQQERGPSRKVYTITEAGLAKLRAWLGAPAELPQLRHPLLIQLAWADELPPGELDALLTRYEQDLEGQVAVWREQQRRGAESSASTRRESFVQPSLARSSREAILWRMILENWLGFYEHELNWVRSLRVQLSREEGEDEPEL